MAAHKPTFLKLLLLLSMSLFSCKEKYVHPITDNNSNFLVVEGLINTGTDSTIFNLSRTFKLDGKTIVTPEKAASVQVESDAGSTYLLSETIKGGKYGASLALDPTKKHRLRIRTKDNNEYLSEFVESRESPPFDLKYDFKNDGLNFHLNTQDPSGKSIYYMHSFEETWEYESHLNSLYKILNGDIVKRNFPQDDIHTCWRVLLSPSIMLTSTANLSADRIENKAIVSIPGSSPKLHVAYSILVKQSVLTPDGFAFWETLRNNTEKVGSVFDTQPSQLFGNIKSTKNPAETVIGFVSAGTVTERRIILHVSEFPTQWFNVEDKSECLEAVHPVIILRQTRAPFIPLEDEAKATDKLSCADCRLLGGSTQKPSYWK